MSANPATLLRPAVLRRRFRHAEARTLVILVALTVVGTFLTWVGRDDVPLAVLTIPLLVGSLVLGPRTLSWFVVFVMVALVLSVSWQHRPLQTRTAVSVAVYLTLGLVVLLMSFRRSRLGVAGMRGESMFVDLRDRILNQGGIPRLPAGWHAESALTAAGGTLFAGDFIVATRPSPERLEVVVADVSGKGEQAGTRALMLSGAFGGLLGALTPYQFLPAANEYLLRQDWDEGFATAVHLSLNLVSGSYEVRTAGHPPALLRAAGSGRWTILASAGPLLGLIEDARFHAVTGTLGSGDAIILYTDGMVEEPRRDIDLGIDRLLGEAESLLRGNFDGAARKLVAALGSKEDDRAMVVIHRT